MSTSSGIGSSSTQSQVEGRAELEHAIAEATVHNAGNDCIHSVRMLLNTHTFEAVGFKELTLLTRTCKVLRTDFMMKIDRRLRALKENLFGLVQSIGLNEGWGGHNYVYWGLAIEMAKDDPEKAYDYATRMLRNSDYYNVLCSIIPKLGAIYSSHFLGALKILSEGPYLKPACPKLAEELAKQPLTAEPAKIAVEKQFRDEEKPILEVDETDEMRLHIEALPSISAQRAIRYALAIRDNDLPFETRFQESDKLLEKVALSLLTSQTSPDAAMMAACFVQSSYRKISVIKKMIDQTQENTLSLIEEYASEHMQGRERDEVLMHLAQKAVKTSLDNAKNIGRQIQDRKLYNRTFVNIATFLLKDRSKEAHSLFRSLGTIEWLIAKEFINEACKYDLEAYRREALQTTNPPDSNLLLLEFVKNIAKVDVKRAVEIAAMPELTNGLTSKEAGWFKDSILCEIIEELAKTDPDQAMSFLPQISNQSIRKEALDTIDEQRAIIAQEAVKTDVQKAVMLAEQVQAQDKRDGVYLLIVLKLVKTDVDEAARVVEKILTQKVKSDAQLDIAKEVAKNSVERALPFIQASAANNLFLNAIAPRLDEVAIDLAKANILKALELAGHNINCSSRYAKTVAAIWSSCTRQNLPPVDASGLSLGYGQFLLEE